MKSKNYINRPCRVMIEYKEFGVEEIVRGRMSCNIAIINVNK